MEWEPDSIAISQEKTTSSHPCNNEVTSATSELKSPKITTFAYEDSYGNTKSIDITDFVGCQNPSKEFLLAVKNKLLLYDYCFAWGSKSTKYKNKKTGYLEGIYGDLVVLDTNFRLNGVESIIRYDNFTRIPYIKCSNQDSSFSPVNIDLLQVFAKPLVKYVIFKNRYKSLHLHDVSTALLGYGKLSSGKDIMNLSVAERKGYCLHDAHIVADLVRVDNGDIMKIMQVISRQTGLKLDEVCHKGMTAIWNKILNNSISKRISLIGYDNIPSVLRKLYSNNQSYIYYTNTNENFDSDLEEEDEDEEDELEEDEKEHYDEQESIQNSHSPKQVFRKYKGAVVLEPKRGVHQYAHLFDVTSLYPTIIIKYNLSPETVNCLCCRDNNEARQTFTPEILTDCKYTEDGYYWICQRKRGLFAKILEELTEERIRYKKSGLEVESQAIKAIINSGYGVFGHPYFKYYDPRVAELVTALGRYTLTKMQDIANGLGFVTLYGDTDSLFVNNIKRNEDAQFIDECKSTLGVEVGHEKTFSKLILVGKKHYIGILSDLGKNPIIKGMEGIKSDRPEFIHRVFMQLVQDIKNDTNPIPKLKQAFQQLDCRQVPAESLAISLVLRKNPEEYSQICKQSRLGTKLGLRKDDTLVYYKCDTQQPVYDVKSKEHKLRTVHESENQDDISYAEYKKMLMNSVKDVLEILGYNADKELLGKKQLISSNYFRRTK
jgi:hypothetical protein